MTLVSAILYSLAPTIAEKLSKRCAGAKILAKNTHQSWPLYLSVPNTITMINVPPLSNKSNYHQTTSNLSVDRLHSAYKTYTRSAAKIQCAPDIFVLLVLQGIDQAIQFL